jgi:hypothetical protein
MRESAVADLNAMPAHLEGSEFARDRIADVEWSNKQLLAMGVTAGEMRAAKVAG